MERYDNGEIKTKDRIEDEKWYIDYQQFMEFCMGEVLTTHNDLDSYITSIIDRMRKYGLFSSTYYNQKELEDKMLQWGILHYERSKNTPKELLDGLKMEIEAAKIKTAEEFIKQHCVKVKPNEDAAYVELMMDNHKCIEWEEEQYYIPENRSGEIYNYLINNHLYE